MCRENGSLSIADISSMDALMMRRIPPRLAYIAALSFSCAIFAVYTFINIFTQYAYYPKGEICPQTEKSPLGLDRVHNHALRGLCTLSISLPVCAAARTLRRGCRLKGAAQGERAKILQARYGNASGSMV